LPSRKTIDWGLIYVTHHFKKCKKQQKDIKKKRRLDTNTGQEYFFFIKEPYLFGSAHKKERVLKRSLFTNLLSHSLYRQYTIKIG